MCVCLLFVATNFHNFCCCARTSFATVFTFFHHFFHIFLLLFWYLSWCCFLFAFTLGFLATGLVFSAAPFVRRISRLFWDQQDREPIHEKSVWCFCLSFYFFFNFVAVHVLTWWFGLWCQCGHSFATQAWPNPWHQTREITTTSLCVCWKSVIEPFFLRMVRWQDG